MTVNYTTNLSLGQPVTGTESGTWGDDVNNAVTSYLDIAIAGGLAITVTTADVTLTITQGTSVATNIGSTTAQYAILNVSGAMTAARNLIVPSSSRIYLINNNTTGGFALTVKGSATTGVTLVNGEKAHVFWNGSDYAKLSNSTGAAGSFSSITDSGNLTFTGTGNRITGDFTNGTIASRVAFQTSTTNGNTVIGLLTNGTATSSSLQVNNVSDTTTALSFGNFQISSTEVTLQSNIRNSGTYLPMTFYTGGSERVKIDTSGNVGIGTSSPSDKLDVQSSGDLKARVYTSGTTVSIHAALTLKTGSYEYLIQNFTTTATSAGALRFYDVTAGTERMRIDSSGNVGIGTTGPVANTRLTLSDTNSSKLNITGGSNQNGMTFAVTGTSNEYYVAGGANLLTGGDKGFLIYDVTNARAKFYVEDVTGETRTLATTFLSYYTGASERMRIDSSGNVGIGTSSPVAQFAVYGAGQTTAAMSTSSGLGGTLYVRDSGGASGNGGAVMFGANQGAFAAIKGLITDGANNTLGALAFSNRNASTDATLTERMRLDPSGTVLINQTASYTSAFGESPRFQVSQLRGTSPSIPAAFYCFGNDGVGARIALGKSRGTAIGTQTIVQNGDELGGVYFCGSDGTNMNQVAASITGISGGVPGATADMPGALLFNTTADGAGSPTEKMRIDSSGNVGIGTSSPSTFADGMGPVLVAGTGNNFATIQGRTDGPSGATNAVSYGGSYQANPINGARMFVCAAGSAGQRGIITFCTKDLDDNSTQPVERVRIDSSGNLMVGTTSVSSPNPGIGLAVGGNAQITIGHDTTSASGQYYIPFKYNATVIGGVTQSGTTAVLYNVTSDQRLKENIQDADSASNLIDSLQVRKFDWKTDNTHQRYGFVAQELITVAPEAVHQPADPEEMMAVDYSKLVPMLVKEIQSLRKRLTALEST
jgi:hypothetical protein